MAESQFAEACMAQKTALIVLNVGGMAPPVVSGLLEHLGGDAPMSATDDKKKSLIGRFNETLIQSCGGSFQQWTSFDRQWLLSPKAAEFLDKALNLLKSEFNDSYLMILDDPGITRLLPFWNIVFEHAGILPRYLFVLEDATDLAAALHPDIDAHNAHLIWLRVALDAEYFSRGHLRAFVDSVSLAEQPSTIIKELAGTLQLNFPRDVQSVLGLNENVIEPLRNLVGRRKSETAILGRASQMTDWVKVVQMTLAEWSGNGEMAENRYLLDAVREAFDDATPAFVRIGSESSESKRKLRQLQQCLDEARAEAAQSRKSEVHLRSMIEQREVRAAEVKTELTGRISHLESTLAQRKAELDDTRQLLDDARRQISSLDRELTSSRTSAEEQLQHLRELAQQSGSAAEQAQEQVRERYREIVTLTRKLASETAAAQKFKRQSTRLSTIARIFEEGAGRGFVARWFGWLLPQSWHMRQIRQRLESSGVFDEGAYLMANPDVARAAIDPLRHYLVHGVDEGRPLGIE